MEIYQRLLSMRSKQCSQFVCLGMIIAIVQSKREKKRPEMPSWPVCGLPGSTCFPTV